MRWIIDEYLILDGTGDRDGAHGGSIGENKGKKATTIVVSVGSASVQTTFTPPLYLKGRDYELAMVNLET